ncbi:MAG TPA: hypothetical protein VF735_12240 [Pyrinomonadaceae bacterium]|jgi:hypothetical protein
MINLNGTAGEDGGALWKVARTMASDSTEESGEETQQPEGTEDQELEDAARDEREYVRQRLSEELGREPTQSELDEWLRQHTEGY